MIPLLPKAVIFFFLLLDYNISFLSRYILLGQLLSAVLVLSSLSGLQKHGFKRGWRLSRDGSGLGYHSGVFFLFF